jgi:hypothetical protein
VRLRHASATAVGAGTHDVGKGPRTASCTPCGVKRRNA